MALLDTILYSKDVEKLNVDLESVKMISKDLAEKVQATVFFKKENSLKLITTNNFPDELKVLIKKLENKGYIIKTYYTTTDGFKKALERYEQISTIEKKKDKESAAIKQAAGKSAIAMIQKLYKEKKNMEANDFIMEIVRLAFQAGASDLHFQSENERILLRLRIDGIMQDVLEFTHQEFNKYQQKIKFSAGMKMNVDYVPQDGRFTFLSTTEIGDKKKVDVRVNTMPGLKSESIEFRFLDSDGGFLSFQDIGISDHNYQKIKKALEKKSGIIILSGPTGSGKTTTLYSMLNTLNDGKEKIITLEDPIEYTIPGIQQSQVNTSKGYTYEEGLKATLRHDPDTILLGEIRSKETAEICANAALTGHRVLTTLHVNSAIESISRLENMGIKPYIIGSSINMIISQRLVRKICSHCQVHKELDYAQKARINEKIDTIRTVNPEAIAFLKAEDIHKGIAGTGCEKCNNTGYSGRIAILEVLEVTENIKKAIIFGKDVIEMFSKAREQGFLTTQEEAIIKVLKGITTLNEIRRVL